LENNINAYGKEERQRRSESMSYKKIDIGAQNWKKFRKI